MYKTHSTNYRRCLETERNLKVNPGNRLDKLERETKAVGEPAFGVERDGSILDKGTGETLSREEWERRHPDGILFIVIRGEPSKE